MQDLEQKYRIWRYVTENPWKIDKSPLNYVIEEMFRKSKKCSKNAKMSVIEEVFRKNAKTSAKPR